MDFSLVIPAFIAGIFTFLAPCTLPLVPAYLGFISGVSSKELTNPATADRAKKKIFLNGLFFIFGFSAIFIIFGLIAGFFGQLFFNYRIWLSRLGGIFVILFGLFMLDIIKIPFLSREIRIKTPNFLKKGRVLNSFILGSTFGLGWTPCVGPVLGSILTLAATSATALQGAFLLGIFSLGLALPFLLIAVSFSNAFMRLAKIAKYLNVISVIGGIFLIFLGVLLLTNKLRVWVAFFYGWFNFINYEKLLDYL